MSIVLEHLANIGATVRFPNPLESDGHNKEDFLTVWFDTLDFDEMKMDEDNDLMIPIYY